MLSFIFQGEDFVKEEKDHVAEIMSHAEVPGKVISIMLSLFLIIPTYIRNFYSSIKKPVNSNSNIYFFTGE